MDNAKTYSLPQVLVTFGGAPIPGPGKTSYVEASKKDDDFEVEVMADGATIYSYKASDLWIVKITLAQTSLGNVILSAIRTADLVSIKQGLGGSGMLPFGIGDTLGSTLLASPRTRIVKPADIKFNNGIEDREWTFACSNVAAFIGGQA